MQDNNSNNTNPPLSNVFVFGSQDPIKNDQNSFEFSTPNNNNIVNPFENFTFLPNNTNQEIKIDSNNSNENPSSKFNYIVKYKDIMDAIEKGDTKKLEILLKQNEYNMINEILKLNRKFIVLKSTKEVNISIANFYDLHHNKEEVFYYTFASTDEKKIKSLLVKKIDKKEYLDYAMEASCLKDLSLVKLLITNYKCKLNEKAIKNIAISGNIQLIMFMLMLGTKLPYDGICESNNEQIFREFFTKFSNNNYTQLLQEVRMEESKKSSKQKKENSEESEDYIEEDYGADEDDVDVLGINGSCAGGHLDRFKVFYKLVDNLDRAVDEAIKNGHFNILEYMVNEKMRISCPDNQLDEHITIKITWPRIFYKACSFNSVPIIDKIINQLKIPVDYEKALENACEGGYSYLAKHFIENNGAKNLEKALHSVITHQLPVMLLQNFLQGFNQIDPKELNKANEGKVKMIEFLVGEGVNINFNNSYPIFRSTELGMYESVIHLLYFGSSTSNKNNKLIKFAKHKDNKKVKKLMKAHKKGEVWSPKRHSSFPPHFQQRTLTLLLSIKHLLKKTSSTNNNNNNNSNNSNNSNNNNSNNKKFFDYKNVFSFSSPLSTFTPTTTSSSSFTSTSLPGEVVKKLVSSFCNSTISYHSKLQKEKGKKFIILRQRDDEEDDKHFDQESYDKVCNWLKSMGEDPKSCSYCLLLGIQKGYYPMDLEAVVLETPCEDCKEPLVVKVKDILYQTDYAGTDYEEGSEGASVQCEECESYFYIANLCSGKPNLDSGKFHNHCRKCPGFGKCLGDYREEHCRNCGNHYFAGLSGFPCENCSQFTENDEYGNTGGECSIF